MAVRRTIILGPLTRLGTIETRNDRDREARARNSFSFFELDAFLISRKLSIPRNSRFTGCFRTESRYWIHFRTSACRLLIGRGRRSCFASARRFATFRGRESARSAKLRNASALRRQFAVAGSSLPTVLDFPAAAGFIVLCKPHPISFRCAGVAKLRISAINGGHYQSQFDLPFRRDAQRRNAGKVPASKRRRPLLSFGPLCRFYANV